jgi:hypothetical protein
MRADFAARGFINFQLLAKISTPQGGRKSVFDKKQPLAISS